jgi:hypothetical protein
VAVQSAKAEALAYLDAKAEVDRQKRVLKKWLRERKAYLRGCRGAEEPVSAWKFSLGG